MCGPRTATRTPTSSSSTAKASVRPRVPALRAHLRLAAARTWAPRTRPLVQAASSAAWPPRTRPFRASCKLSHVAACCCTHGGILCPAASAVPISRHASLTHLSLFPSLFPSLSLPLSLSLSLSPSLSLARACCRSLFRSLSLAISVALARYFGRSRSLFRSLCARSFGRSRSLFRSLSLARVRPLTRYLPRSLARSDALLSHVGCARPHRSIPMECDRAHPRARHQDAQDAPSGAHHQTCAHAHAAHAAPGCGHGHGCGWVRALRGRLRQGAGCPSAHRFDGPSRRACAFGACVRVRCMRARSLRACVADAADAPG